MPGEEEEDDPWLGRVGAAQTIPWVPYRQLPYSHIQNWERWSSAARGVQISVYMSKKNTLVDFVDACELLGGVNYHATFWS